MKRLKIISLMFVLIIPLSSCSINIKDDINNMTSARESAIDALAPSELMYDWYTTGLVHVKVVERDETVYNNDKTLSPGSVIAIYTVEVIHDCYGNISAGEILKFGIYSYEVLSILREYDEFITYVSDCTNDASSIVYNGYVHKIFNYYAPSFNLFYTFLIINNKVYEFPDIYLQFEGHDIFRDHRFDNYKYEPLFMNGDSIETVYEKFKKLYKFYWSDEYKNFK